MVLPGNPSHTGEPWRFRGSFSIPITASEVIMNSDMPCPCTDFFSWRALLRLLVKISHNKQVTWIFKKYKMTKYFSNELKANKYQTTLHCESFVRRKSVSRE